MEDILHQYQVKFSSPADYGTHNRIDSVNDWLSLFIEDHYSLYESNRLLSGVTAIINSDDATGGGFDTQSLYLAIINCNTTNIYSDLDDYFNDSKATPSFSLPTSDFQIIVQAWRDYLVNSPVTPK